MRNYSEHRLESWRTRAVVAIILLDIQALPEALKTRDIGSTRITMPKDNGRVSENKITEKLDNASILKATSSVNSETNLDKNPRNKNKVKSLDTQSTEDSTYKSNMCIGEIPKIEVSEHDSTDVLGREDQEGPEINLDDYRHLHDESEAAGNCDKLHELSELQSENDILKSNSTKNMFGMCTCLRGSVYPYITTDTPYQGWSHDLTSVSCHVIFDSARNVNNESCAFSNSKSYNSSRTQSNSSQNANKLRRYYTRFSHPRTTAFRHHKDIRQYMAEYRKWNSSSGDTEELLAVLQTSFSVPFVSNLQILSSAQKALESQSVVNTGVSDPPSLNEIDTLKPSSVKVLQRMENLNLAPVSSRIKIESTGGDIELREGLNLKSNRAMGSMGSLSALDKYAMGSSTSLTSKHSDTGYNRSKGSDSSLSNLDDASGLGNNSNCSINVTVTSPFDHIMRNQIAKDSQVTKQSGAHHARDDSKPPRPRDDSKPPRPREARLNVASVQYGQLPLSKPSHSKKFTASSQYLELSTPRLIFPLPVHILVNNSERDNMVHTVPARLPRCRSASSNKTNKAKAASSSSSESNSMVSQPALLRTMGKSRTFGGEVKRAHDGFCKRHLKLNERGGVFVDPVSVIQSLTSRNKSTTTGQILLKCMEDPDLT